MDAASAFRSRGLRERSGIRIMVHMLSRIVVASACACVFVVACGGSSGPATFAVTGTVFADCTTLYSGVDVVVEQPNGVKVAVAHLRPSGRLSGDCERAFMVTGVPDGYPVYTVVVGQSTGRTFTRAELRRPLSLVDSN